MKTHTHTAGPWAIAGNYILSGCGSYHLAMITAIDKDMADEWEANARLIASAPDFLAALESLAIGLSPASVDMQRENLAELCMACREIAENAIAKAKGGDA